jgi:hypothetical protein
MWAEITRHLYQFESAVLSGLDQATRSAYVAGPIRIPRATRC